MTSVATGRWRETMIKLALAVSSAFLLLSCGSELPPTGSESADITQTEQATTSVGGQEAAITPDTAGTSEAPSGGALVDEDVGPSDADPAGSLVIDALANAVPIDRRLLGINVPAWVGGETLADPDFQYAARESGTTVIRMPGGSWSNSYDWLGCEQGDEEQCFWTWAARPTDFIDFLEATGLDGMWTASINETAQQSAAAVAFFNGQVGDPTVIGVDREGVDWATVGTWAQLRATNGNPEPVGIQLWEIGNEVFGGDPTIGGAQCASFGWENVWTCDGTEYVSGINGRGAHGYDGALAHREAMLAVDPTIEVGFVGVDRPDAWNDWGYEVIDTAGDAMDFYVIHDYGFDRSPRPTDAVRLPGESWPGVIEAARTDLPPGVDLAFTEFNLVAIQDQDTEQTMTRAMNAFYLAISIGELAVGQVEIANWWNLANGVAQNGTDYGLVSRDEQYTRSPAFWAFAMWGRTGSALLDTPERNDALRVFPTRHDDGRLSIIVINPGSSSITTDVVVRGLEPGVGSEVIIETVVAADLEDQQIEVRPAENLGSADSRISLTFPAWSISLIETQESST